VSFGYTGTPLIVHRPYPFAMTTAVIRRWEPSTRMGRSKANPPRGPEMAVAPRPRIEIVAPTTGSPVDHELTCPSTLPAAGEPAARPEGAVSSAQHSPAATTAAAKPERVQCRWVLMSAGMLIRLSLSTLFVARADEVERGAGFVCWSVQAITAIPGTSTPSGGSDRFRELMGGSGTLIGSTWH
jgi:hypothetical protein